MVRRCFAAYNAGDVADALDVLSPDVLVSDCDYARRRTLQFEGRAQVQEWLLQRIADHDQLHVKAISNSNPDPASSAIGIEFARRSSDTLRMLGLNDGISPKLLTNVSFSGAPERIAVLALGSVGGDRFACTPD